jgi:hypothetical protein
VSAGLPRPRHCPRARPRPSGPEGNERRSGARGALCSLHPNQAERTVIYALATSGPATLLELPQRLGEVPRALADGRVMSPSHRHRKPLPPPQRTAHGVRASAQCILSKRTVSLASLLFREMPDAVANRSRREARRAWCRPPLIGAASPLTFRLLPVTISRCRSATTRHTNPRLARTSLGFWQDEHDSQLAPQTKVLRSGGLHRSHLGRNHWPTSSSNHVI